MLRHSVASINGKLSVFRLPFGIKIANIIDFMSARKSYWIHTAKATSSLGNVDRINEVLFGLIMVLTFTCSISVATHAREDISTLLWSALGCNVAWGFVDAMMYLFSILLERGEAFERIRMIRNGTTEETENKAVTEALPPLIAQILKKEHLKHISNELKNLPEPPAKVFLTLHDTFQAVKIFVLVF